MAALMPQGKQQYFTAGGIPLVGGKVYTYAAGTTTPLATYTDAAAGTPNTNPVILDSRGEASIFFGAVNYKIVVKDSLDSTIWTQDNLAGDAAGKLRTDLAASGGSANVGHISTGTGAVATTVQDELRTSKKVSQFGTVQQAFDHCIANNFDLEVDQLYTLTTAINIDRLVDGAAFDNYFRVFTKNGGGFVVSTAIAMFSSSISFSTSPVSQLVFFDGITFIGNSGASYVLNDGRFLRTRFDSCNFDKILCCNSTIYTQSIYITNCNIRRIIGTFWTSTAQCYDFKFIGNIVEAVTGSVLNLAKAMGCAVIGNLLEGISGTAIIYNGAAGLQISGNYFEANGLDIDGTGAVQASGVHITGNYYSHTTGASNPLTYSVVWGNGSPVNCVSIGNHSNARLHNFPVVGMDVLVKDSATDILYNNEPRPLFLTTIALNDGALGGTYGGVIKGYGLGGRGGLLGLGILNAGTYTEGITIDENANITFPGNLFIGGNTASSAVGQLNIGKTVAATVGAAGAAAAPPATPETYLQVSLNGTYYKIPLYKN